MLKCYAPMIQNVATLVSLGARGWLKYAVLYSMLFCGIPTPPCRYNSPFFVMITIYLLIKISLSVYLRKIYNEIWSEALDCRLL